MSDQIFYVGAQDENHRLTGFVPAKFLMRNGSYVMDPTPGGSQKAYLYSDGQGNNKTNGAIANPSNYLIVPANHTERGAKDFAAQIAATIGRVYPEDETGSAGLHQALGRMIGAFWQGGPQDLQRHPQWGIPRGSTVPAFIGSASNHLGYVTGLAGLPMNWSEIGGGGANLFHRLGITISTRAAHISFRNKTTPTSFRVSRTALLRAMRRLPSTTTAILPSLSAHPARLVMAMASRLSPHRWPA